MSIQNETTTLGKRIYSLRKNGSISMEQLAKGIGVSQPTISNLENDKHNPGLDLIIRIVNFFDIDAHWLLFGEKYEYYSNLNPIINNDLYYQNELAAKQRTIEELKLKMNQVKNIAQMTLDQL